MVNKTFIEYFADLFTLRRNLTRIILEYERTNKFESIEKAYRLHLNEMELMDSRLDLLYEHAKKLSARNLNANCHHRTLHLETTNFRKIFKLFEKIEEHGKRLQHIFDKKNAIKWKTFSCLNKYRKVMNAAYKIYDNKCELIYEKWIHKKPKVCFKINQLIGDFVQRSDELQLMTEKSCRNIEYNGMKNLTFQCESITAESLLKLKSMIASNLFKMKVFTRQQKISRKLNETGIIVGKCSKNESKMKRIYVRINMVKNIYVYICEKVAKLDSFATLIPLNWKYRKKKINFNFFFLSLKTTKYDQNQ